MIHDALHAQGLTRCFGATRALDGLDLSVPRGRVLGLLGRNGAGKSTFLRVAAGLLQADAGTLRLFGEDPRTAGHALRARLAYVPQEPRLYGRMHLGDLARVYAGHYPRFDREAARLMAERLEVPARTAAAALSGGQRRKLALLLALASGADLLLLDEPAAGLDPLARRDLYAMLIDRLAEDQGGGTTVVLATHLVGDLERLADLVAILDAGRVLCLDEPAALAAEHVRVQLVADAAAGLDGVAIPGALRQRREGRIAAAVLRLDPATERALADLAARPGLSVERFPLDLEEVFVELVGRAGHTSRADSAQEVPA